MFVELIESLRCPGLHEETRLVATADRSENRHIREGLLGCPTCGAEYPISDGVATFAPAPEPVRAMQASSVEVAMRLAAFLELTDALGFAVLCGGTGAQAGALYALTEMPIVLVNPPVGADSPAVIGVIRTSGAIPLARGSARAVALEPMADVLIESAVAAVRAGGRVTGPVALALPPQVSEIVRDESDWVGQKENNAPEVAPRLVPLQRGRR